MKEIEPGYYHFRAKGMNKQGEMVVNTSYRSYADSYEDLRRQQKEFLASCKSDYGILDPVLTHTVFDDDQRHAWDYLVLKDLNSDF